MNMLRFTGLVLIIALAMVSCGPQGKPAEKITKLVIASDATFPPMEFIDPTTKNVAGFDADLIKAVGDAAGVQIEIVNTAWDGIFASLEAGRFDAIISSVTITEERKVTYDFSDPYVNAGQVVVVPVADNVTTAISDLKGKKAGAQMGTTGDLEIAKYSEIEKKTYEDIGLAFADLAAGRLDSIVVDAPVAANYVLMAPDFSGKFKTVGTPLTSEFYGIVVKKGNAAVLEILNRGLSSLKSSGKLDLLKQKWNL